MKKSAAIAFLILCGITGAQADEQIAQVQMQLKDQGFYYGQVDGNAGAETNAAIRRYQIRNGLQVTGTLTQETLASLKVGGSEHSVPPQQTQPRQQPVASGAPSHSTPKKSLNESDHDFLQQQGGAVSAQPAAPEPQEQTPQPPAPNVVTVPAQVPTQPADISIQYSVLFRRTPYENAPLEVQQNTLRSAQLRLVHERFYDGAVDGIPGPATGQAIVMFQGAYRLNPTGRLDIDTLNIMRLLPNERHMVTQPFYPPSYNGPQRVYRGIWVR